MRDDGTTGEEARFLKLSKSGFTKCLLEVIHYRLSRHLPII